MCCASLSENSVAVPAGQRIVVALDAMGGDLSVKSVIEGADIFLSELFSFNYNVNFQIYGNQENIMSVLSKYKKVEASSVLIHAPEVVLAGDKPSVALRTLKKSSMRLAVDAVKSGEANCAVSSGNTGALMAISRFVLGTLPNIYRPAIVSTFPSKGKDFILLDLGANVDCNAESLFQFAVMGSAFAKVVLNRDNPGVALLNIGSEDIKGNDQVKSAFSLLKNFQGTVNFMGYVEANGVFEGNVDVVVADGFVGNVLLKTAEAAASTIVEFVEKAIHNSLITKIAGFFVKKSLKNELKRFDPKTRNGAMFIGLNGVVVKSHGNADGVAFAHAIRIAVEAISNNLNQNIVEKLGNLEQ